MSLIIGLISCFICIFFVVLFYKKYVDGLDEKVEATTKILATAPMGYNPHTQQYRRMKKFVKLEEVINNPGDYSFIDELRDLATVTIDVNDEDLILKVNYAFEKNAEGYAELYTSSFCRHISQDENEKIIFYFTQPEEEILNILNSTRSNP